MLVVGFALGGVAQGASAKADWKEIEKLVQMTGQLGEQGDRSEADVFNFLNLLNFRLEDFIAKHAAEDRRWDAEVLRLQIVAQLALANHVAVDWAAQQAGYAAVLAARAAKKDAKVGAEAGVFRARLMLLAGAADLTALPALAQDVEAYYDRHRGDGRAAQAAYDVAKLAARVDGARAQSILKKITDDGEGALPAQARALLRVVQARERPLELAFTAFDGRRVDIASLRGKVVLIDFWATWCPPCREETPDIVDAYRRLHAQGFEIIGISLDEDRDKLRNYLQQHAMPWPQHFDGEGWENKFAQHFDIHSIPAMWLVNKRGFLVDVEGRDRLADKVERLLAEQTDVSGFSQGAGQ